ncbi:fructosamine kinase family protein [Thalassotalea mangrovi]|uniref:Fructosamine kinase family protein n=1 Tax=Thalassotalea mangrovi TaxID=2572245 RepID=A0A4U1B218_9GAMM|nr:fructosamine kinase family protein [Thalassotalea mangrovi]TKB43354.1 fructosamine kinase family protein [Thalassotalea mangrovi]
MWSAIADEISQTLKLDLTFSEPEKVTGGDINASFKFSADEQHFFVKTNNASQLLNFQTEMYSLEHLSQGSDFVVPDVICCGLAEDSSFLVIQFLELVPHPLNGVQQSESPWYVMGKTLAQMHQNNQQGEFGWSEDNFIGKTAQANPWQKNWSTFFAEQRLGVQLQELNNKGVDLTDIDEFVGHCQQLLSNHHPTPSLLHGDLWQGNVGFTNKGPSIYDPSCYYGDPEVDIAMTELFGRFPESFYHGYQGVSPLRKNYPNRKLIYNAYHIFNHANLFAGIYLEQAKDIIAKIYKIA